MQCDFMKETMMLLSIILLLVASAATQEEEIEKCPSCIKVESSCYNVSFLFDLNATFRSHVMVHKMGVLRYDNTLFYAFEPPIEDKEYYKVAYVNLDNPEQDGVILDNNNQILNLGTFDIDQDNSIVYLGGSNGIWAIDKEKNLKYYSSRGDNIKVVFYKMYVFFAKSNESSIIEKKGDQFEIYAEDLQVKSFVITKYDELIYLSNFGLFLKKKEETVRLSKNAFFRGLTMDLDGNVYAWWVDGIYKIMIAKNLNRSSVVKVADIPTIGAMAFDNDNNILFNDGRGLYRMTKIANVSACLEEEANEL
ncbi:ommochrome-binding protein-like isoform X2 [Plodia interpunctella]|uniref:ommochrome-binding protein-like isoform X2 n=1 Tax=Plodia interpunctella TaxID=58824 RepID=UPI002368EC45|nr:ommochrome-binding protein-like isoform X2 [Plodia interpunctella]